MRSAGVLAVFAILTASALPAVAQDGPSDEASTGPIVPAPEAEIPSVRVYVSSDRPQTVFGSAAALGTVRRLRWPRQPADDYHYERGVCVAPCVATVPLGGNPYRIVGHDVASSKPFNLVGDPAGLDIDVHAAPYGANVVGVVLTSLGLVFTALGGAELIAWGALNASTDTQEVGKVFLIQGIAFGSVGLVLATIGIPTWVANHTSVEITEHSNRGAREVTLTASGLRF
jgi:hypothetical protein